MRSPLILRIFKNNQLLEVKQFTQDQIVIGRQADVQIDLDDDKVSPIHCLIELRETKYFVCDLGSKTGTFKNGQAILDEEIESGDDLQVGPFKLVFFVGVPKPKTGPDGGTKVTPIPQQSPQQPVQQQSVTPAPAAPATPNIPSRQEVTHITAVTHNTPVNVAKPIIRSPVVSSNTPHKKIKGKTFAPPSEIKDLKTHFQPTKGTVAEIMVAWAERVITAKHYRSATLIRARDLDLPATVSPGVIVEVRQGIRVYLNSGAEFTLISETGRWGLNELKNVNRIQTDARGNYIKVDQGEIGFLEIPGSNGLQLIVRYVPATAVVPLVPPLMLSAGEVSGVIFSMILVGLVAFLINTLAPPPQAQKDDLTTIAQVVLQKPPPKPINPPPPPPEPPPVKPPEPTPPPPPKTPPKQVTVAEKKQEAQKKGKPAEAQRAQTAGRAAEVRPIPDSKNKPKTFTSAMKQGGAVKLGANAGANAQSKDVTKTGLFSAFGGEGVRKELDKAYQGAGEVMGNADKASGSSGFDKDRAGEDLGGRFKDTGAGGKGTATQGIAGVGTKGRGSGMSAYGNDLGSGEKTSVAITAGGAEEDFAGTIDREAVRRVVRNHKNEIEGCYTRVLNRLNRDQRKALEGKVVLSWDIIEKGAAKGVAVRDTTLHNKEVEECVRSRLATWQFPEPPAGMTATVQSYPFYFRSQN